MEKLIKTLYFIGLGFYLSPVVYYWVVAFLKDPMKIATISGLIMFGIIGIVFLVYSVHEEVQDRKKDKKELERLAALMEQMKNKQ